MRRMYIEEAKGKYLLHQIAYEKLLAIGIKTWIITHPLSYFAAMNVVQNVTPHQVREFKNGKEEFFSRRKIEKVKPEVTVCDKCGHRHFVFLEKAE